MSDSGDGVNFLMKSRLRQRKCTFKWTLEEFSNYENNKEINSRLFYLVKDRLNFFVRIFRNNESLTSFIYYCGHSDRILIKYNVNITDGKEEIWYTNSGTFDTSENYVRIVDGEVCCSEDNNNSCGETVEIVLVLELHEIETEAFYELPTKEVFELDVLRSLSKDISGLVENQTNPDVTLRVDEESVCAHKAILSARSPVFAKMFQQDTEESHTNVVVIEDVEMTTVKELLSFMYSKVRFDYDFQTALALYYAADKYQVLKLREICAIVLVKKLDKENAGSVLRLADRHHDLELKKKMLVFINFNLKTCIKSTWWREIMREETDLRAEMETFIADAH